MRAFPIRDEQDLGRAHELIEELWDAPYGSDEADLLEVMATLVEVYEGEHHALPPGDPVELLRFKLRELDWSQRELGRRLGWGSGRVSEVLNRRRPLTLAMVQQLSEALSIPPGLLVPETTEHPGSGLWIHLPASLAGRVRHASERAGLSTSAWTRDVVERASGILANDTVNFTTGSVAGASNVVSRSSVAA